MIYIPLSDNAVRQLIDSTAIFEEYRRALKAAIPFRGGMYWKQQNDKYWYLVRTDLQNRQKRIGVRSPETEDIFKAFTQKKRQVEERVRSLADALREAERLNKALRVGRVPAIVVALLNELDNAGLAGHFTVVGTHALYAYESAAGVRIEQAALATQDVDLLWDARHRVRFLTDIGKLQTSMLGVLQRVDSTFQRKEDAYSTAINSKGFEVEFLRRQPVEGDEHPFRFTDDDDDLWPVQARRADVLTQSLRFEQTVVSVTGKMAVMKTIDPKVFVQFKEWMATEAPDRPEMKRRRDLRQARIVQSLLENGLIM